MKILAVYISDFLAKSGKTYANFAVTGSNDRIHMSKDYVNVDLKAGAQYIVEVTPHLGSTGAFLGYRVLYEVK